jgi:hypothetical protein
MSSFSIGAGALCLAVFASIAAAQQPRCPCTSYESSVTITISEGSGGAAAVDKNRVCVAKGGEVTFQSSEGDFEVRFDKGDGTPFTPATIRGRQNQRASEKANRPNNVQCGRLYRYTVVLKKGGKELKLDPEIIIEPGGLD